MGGIRWRTLEFSTVTFAAAMAALYLSMRIDLQQPYWSMMTVYIVSQPTAAAVRSKAVQRLIGTLLGAAAALFFVPTLVNTPVLLCLALALWVGGCLAISLLDRSPRSYIMMLAGYTAAIIGFSSVNQPEQIFDLAVARAEEISLGILCATLAHSLWFPRPIGSVLRDRIEHWLGEATQWAQDSLNGSSPAVISRDQLRLATAASEIHILASHLPFDTSHLRETSTIVRAMHDRILMLIPILSSLSDRLCTLRAERQELDEEIKDIIRQTCAWISVGCSPDTARKLIAALSATERIGAGDWYALNRIDLLSRLRDMITVFSEGTALLRHLHDLDTPIDANTQAILAAARSRPMHSDIGLALISGSAAMTAILIACFAWIGLGWVEGGASATIAGILCCLFAAMDDPVPAIKQFAVSICISLLIAGAYVFLIFPAIDNFQMLTMVLAPTMLTIGAMTLNPRHALPAFIILLTFCNYMAIDEHFNPDFARFINTNLSQFLGVFIAMYVTRSFRSMSAESRARRLLKLAWKNLSRLAHGKDREAPEAFASRMIDRLALLAPQLAASTDEKFTGRDVFRELRVGMDLVALQDIRRQMPAEVRTGLKQLLHALGDHYAARSAGRPADDSALLPAIDETLPILAHAFPGTGGRGLAALVGLRRNLFPDARFPAPGVT